MLSILCSFIYVYLYAKVKLFENNANLFSVAIIY